MEKIYQDNFETEKDFPKRFKQIRKELRKSQKDFGKDLGISFRTIQRYENLPPEAKLLEALQKIHSYGYDLNWLISGTMPNNYDI